MYHTHPYSPYPISQQFPQPNPPQQQPHDLLIDPFLLQSLQNPRERLTILKLDAELERFLRDPRQTKLEFPPMSSYQRMIIHKVAAYFKIHHTAIDLPLQKRAVHLYKTVESRIPVLRLSDLREQDETPNTEMNVTLLKRPQHRAPHPSKHSQPTRTTKKAMKKEEGGGRLEEKFEQRQKEYLEARRRIFSGGSGEKVKEGKGEEKKENVIPNKTNATSPKAILIKKKEEEDEEEEEKKENATQTREEKKVVKTPPYKTLKSVERGKEQRHKQKQPNMANKFHTASKATHPTGHHPATLPPPSFSHPYHHREHQHQHYPPQYPMSHPYAMHPSYSSPTYEPQHAQAPRAYPAQAPPMYSHVPPHYCPPNGNHDPYAMWGGVRREEMQHQGAYHPSYDSHFLSQLSGLSLYPPNPSHRVPPSYEAKHEQMNEVYHHMPPPPSTRMAPQTSPSTQPRGLPDHILEVLIPASTSWEDADAVATDLRQKGAILKRLDGGRFVVAIFKTAALAKKALECENRIYSLRRVGKLAC